jgi:poly [ADP-ribose] polymerase
MTKKFTMLLMSNATENNNKFYEVKLEDDDSVIARYGRVGAQGVVENKGYGESTFDSVIAKKKKKGYREVDILTTNNVATTSTASSPVHTSLVEVAKRDIAKHNPELNQLLERLAKINKFQLLAASGGQIDIVDGVVRTPLGLVTLNSVKTAQDKLVSLEHFIKTSHSDDKGYISTLEDYLTLVPQKIPAKRGWHTAFFTEFTSFQKQNELLEQLENSIISNSAAPPTPVTDKKDAEVKRVFGYSLDKVSDRDVFKRVEKYYTSNINRGHACSHLKLKNLFVITNDDKKARYHRMLGKVGNEKQLWHGTRAHNVLSILKAGLIIPTSSGGYTITGRMFGDGVYFSDQSSKSLNYAHGYWGGGPRENNCFMFLANVAMGKEYVPPRPMHRPPAGYDSMFAIGGKSGVANNEMIVYDLDQTHLAYLCEFDA